MSVAHIPPSEVALLIGLQDARDLPALRARVAALHDAGFTLGGIVVPMGRPLSTIRAWESAHRVVAAPGISPLVPVPTPDRPPRRAGTAVRMRHVRPDVPVHDRPRLRHLARTGRAVRRFTAATSPARSAQAELEAALVAYLDRNVPAASLARYCGVTSRAVHARLERAAMSPVTVHAESHAGRGYVAAGLPPVPVPPVGAVRHVDPGTPYVTVQVLGDSPRGALTTHWDGNLVATRTYEQVSRSRAGDGSRPVVLRPDVAGAAFLDGWLRTPSIGTSVAVPLVLVEHVLGWGPDLLARVDLDQVA